MFGLKPWDVIHLSRDEVDVYRQALAERVEEQQRTQVEVERQRGAR